MLNEIKPLRGLISPAKYARQVVDELTGTGIHHLDVPEFEMGFICLKNCLIETASGRSINHTPDVFLTSGTQYA